MPDTSSIWDLIRRYSATRQVEAAPWRALRHVLGGEAGDALVLVREPLQLGAGDVAIEIVEGPIAHQLLHAADEVVRRMLAVGAHDPGGRARAHGLVGGERGQRVAPAARQSASVRASRMAWAAPLEPRGYIGCAASPSRVTRPKVQRSTGSRSTMGYSKMTSERRSRSGTSSQSNVQPAKMGRKSSSRPGLFQSFRS